MQYGDVIAADGSEFDEPVVLRPDQGPEHSLAYVGMIVFLGSSSILFAALFFMFSAFRVGQGEWPPDGLPRLPLLVPTVNAGVVLLSSATLHRGGRWLRRGHPKTFGRFLTAAAGLGSLFVALQAVYWFQLWQAGFQIATGLYSSYFYLLTVFHGIHAAVGVMSLWLLLPELRRPVRPRRAVRVKTASMFWHFVGAMWIVTYLLVFLT